MERILHRLRWFALLGLTLAWQTGLSAAQEAAPILPQDPNALSPRNANYRVEVTLDPDSKTLEGRQTLTWSNIQEQPTDERDWPHHSRIPVELTLQQTQSQRQQQCTPGDPVTGQQLEEDDVGGDESAIGTHQG